MEGIKHSHLYSVSKNQETIEDDEECDTSRVRNKKIAALRLDERVGQTSRNNLEETCKIQNRS